MANNVEEIQKAFVLLRTEGVSPSIRESAMRTIVDSNPAFRQAISQNSMLRPEEGESELTDKQLVEQLDANIKLQKQAELDSRDPSEKHTEIVSSQKDRAFSEIDKRQKNRVI